jgi:hypothetical protein
MAKKMKISEKYLETLRVINDWTTVSEWAVKFGELHPDLLEKAHNEALNHKKPSTGLREIAARIGSWISTGDFEQWVQVDDSERPRKVRYISPEEATKIVVKEIEEDVEPLNRAERIFEHEKSLTQKEKYRVAEIFDIAKTTSRMFRLDFEVDHAQAILSETNPGKHHPDNLQILTKSHNVRKNNSNWVRFTFEEQIDYMKSVIKVQKIVEHKMALELDDALIENIISRLKLVY